MSMKHLATNLNFKPSGISKLEAKQYIISLGIIQEEDRCPYETYCISETDNFKASVVCLGLDL